MCRHEKTGGARRTRLIFLLVRHAAVMVCTILEGFRYLLCSSESARTVYGSTQQILLWVVDNTHRMQGGLKMQSSASSSGWTGQICVCQPYWRASDITLAACGLTSDPPTAYPSLHSPQLFHLKRWAGDRVARQHVNGQQRLQATDFPTQGLPRRFWTRRMTMVSVA